MGLSPGVRHDEPEPSPTHGEEGRKMRTSSSWPRGCPGTSNPSRRWGRALPAELARLAALRGDSPTDDQIHKAASKPGFKAKAVTGKLAGKPKLDLDAPVYVEGDDGTESLADEMLSSSRRSAARAGRLPADPRRLAGSAG